MSEISSQYSKPLLSSKYVLRFYKQQLRAHDTAVARPGGQATARTHATAVGMMSYIFR